MSHLPSHSGDHASSTVVDWCEITLTQRCNQRCFFCYEDARNLAKDPELSEVKRLLRETHEHAEQVVLCGKEVLLRPDVLDIVAFAASLGLRVVVFTNGQALSREGLVNGLVEAGCSSVTVSFHFPDAQTFAQGSRTSPKGFERVLQGLRRVAAYNRSHPGRVLGLSTETDMSRLNAGRLAEMRHTLRDLLGDSPWSMRIASLLPTRIYDIGLDHALVPFLERQHELAELLATHPADLPLKFVKMPLCLLPPGYEHLSLEVEYIHAGTALTFNHADADNITVDTITPSLTRDLPGVMASHPYRWVCRKCQLASLCRFERVDWHHRCFEPTRQQKPILRCDPTALEVLARLGDSPAATAAVREISDSLAAMPFPEEVILDSLTRGAKGEPTLVDAWVDGEPILVVELRENGHSVILHLAPPPRQQDTQIGALVGYLNVRVMPGQTTPNDALCACLRALARVELPPIERWADSPWFDPSVAKLWWGAWRRFGELLWPELGNVASWTTRAVRLTGSGALELSLAHGTQGRVVIVYQQDWRGAEHTSIVVDARGQRSVPKKAYRNLLEGLRRRAGNVRAELRILRGTLPEDGEGSAAESAAADEHSTEGLAGLRFRVHDRHVPATYRFEVTSHEPGRACFRSVGNLALRHLDKRLTPRSEAMARVLIAAMGAMQAENLDRATLPKWHRAVARLLDHAKLSPQVEIEVEWSDPAPSSP